MTRLRVCESCARHVFADEPRCPFCDTALAPPALAQVSIVQAGLSRAQRLALAAAVLGQAAVGCADGNEPSGPQAGQGGGGMAGMVGAGSGGGGGEVDVPVYGAPVEPVAGTGGGAGMAAAGSGGSGGPMVMPVYGAPVEPPDAGVAGGGAAGAGDDFEEPPGVPIYGAPPLPEK